jgi:Taurine catabolism dioxygenase TauD, TfdA family
LENSFAWHDYAHSRGKIASDLAGAEERTAVPAQCWRMVWRNPKNGRGTLYLAPHASAVEGMDEKAGTRVIEELTAAATAPGSSYLHQWRRGDVVMWDNRATMHRGRPWPWHEPRLMIRTTVSARGRRPCHNTPAVLAGSAMRRLRLRSGLDPLERRRNLRRDHECRKNGRHAHEPQKLIHREHRSRPNIKAILKKAAQFAR